MGGSGAAGAPTVLVTGGAGYIGSVLVESLLERGYGVTVVDRFFFGPTLADLEGHPSLNLVNDDVRTFPPGLLRGIDAVVDMAALSNDPAGELDPENTLSINFRGRAKVARLAREQGVKRYVLASSCSVYGFQAGVVDEGSPVDPLTTYAEASYRAEQAALSLADGGFAATVLRQATVYGPSRRMRFDLAVNGMALGLFKTGRIPVLRDGSQWRPMVHVRDTCRAFIQVLESPPDQVSGEVFNVGSDDQNTQIMPLAGRIAGAVGRPLTVEWYGDADRRSYQVSFRKLRDRLGYATEHTPEDAAREVFAGLQRGTLRDVPTTRTVEWYKQLLAGQTTLREPVLDDAVL